MFLFVRTVGTWRGLGDKHNMNNKKDEVLVGLGCLSLMIVFALAYLGGYT